MTEIVNPSQNILDILLVIIKRKQEHAKEGKAIAKLEAIYKSELKTIEDKLHKTADGSIMLIENMEDDHLLNTVKQQLRYHYGRYSDIPQAYMDEIKKRPALLEKLLAYEPVIEGEDTDTDDDRNWSARYGECGK